jgi:hypothetical protein
MRLQTLIARNNKRFVSVTAEISEVEPGTLTYPYRCFISFQ